MIIRKVRGKGRCVFANKYYNVGVIVMKNHILVVPASDWSKLKGTIFEDYAFDYGKRGYIALGEISLLSHSHAPNCCITYDPDKMTTTLHALKKIKVGDELTIDYDWGSYPWEKKS